MTEATALKFIGAHPPEFSDDKIHEILDCHYGVKGDLTPLWGERDQNLKVRTGADQGFVLKISNVREEADNIDFQIKAMQHLAQHAPSLAVPHVQPLLSGEDFGEVTDKDGNAHLIHLITLLDGVNLADVETDKKILRAVGHTAGDAATGLRGFFHPKAGHHLFWDVRHLEQYIPYISHLSDAGTRQMVSDFIETFSADILPRLNGMRSQIIHHDTNDANILVDPDDPSNVTGLVDFGDLIHGPIALDAAVAAGEIAQNADEAASIIKGYDDAHPLQEDEIEILYDLMMAREVLGILIGATRKMHDVNSGGVVGYDDIYGQLLENLMTMGREKVRKTLREACGFPEYCPPNTLPTGTNLATTENLIERRHAVLGTALPLSYRSPVHTVRGEGVWLYDVDGRKYLDCYNNVPHVGHCHPYVVKAIARQSAALNTNTRYVTENVVTYSERLKASLPGDLGACLYVNSGSEANDLALRIAKLCSAQDGAMIVDGAYHGITSEIYALSPAAEWDLHESVGAEHISRRRSDIETVANPDVIRGPYGRDDPQAGEKYAADADRAISALRAAGHPIGAFMIDSSFSTHGILDVPDGYVSGVTGRVHDAGGLVIADEVQYGFGRSGNHMWGFQNYGIQPDIVTMGKPIGNGLSMGVVVTTPEILEKFTRLNEFFSTFGGNPVACAAAMAVMDVIEDENLVENAKTTGHYLREGLRRVSAGSQNIGDVRGQGLFIGVDVVSDPDTMAPDAEECSRIKNYLRDHGVLVGSDGIGENILKIRPPLVFAPEHADILIETFEQAIKKP